VRSLLQTPQRNGSINNNMSSEHIGFGSAIEPIDPSFEPMELPSVWPEPIPSMRTLSATEVDELREHLRHDALPLYLEDIATARELDEDQRLYDIEGNPRTPPSVTDYPNRGDFEEAYDLWVPKNEQGKTHYVDHNPLPAARLLERYRGDNPDFWQRCVAQVQRTQYQGRSLIGLLFTQEDGNNTTSVADRLQQLKPDTWITERFMQDVVLDISQRDHRIYESLRTLCIGETVSIAA
jgi:hypothetical protein